MLFEFAEEDEGSLTELRQLLSRLEQEIGTAETECCWPERMTAITQFVLFIQARAVRNPWMG